MSFMICLLHMLVLKGQLALIITVIETSIDLGEEVFRPVATIAHIFRRELGFK
jgi:hypothetical protein